MQVYLDNSATTKCYEEVIDITSQIMREDYGNPSSLHKMGMVAEKHIKDAKEIIAKQLKIKDKEIIFTSGGTESNNLAIIGGARANHRSGKHIITTKIEHPATLEAMKYLEGEGFEITYLDARPDCMINLEELQNALRKDTILVSIMYVNNEIGLIADMANIAKVIKEYNPKILIHVDAIQAFGKIKILPNKLNIDMMSVSAHKIHGPKGCGFLYVKEGSKVTPTTYGGGQQGGRRSGTENVIGIAGMATAIRVGCERFNENIEEIKKLRDIFLESLVEIEDVVINSGSSEYHAPHIINASFIGIKSEVLLHALEAKGIYVSSGSACASNHPKPSDTLTAIGRTQEEIDSAIRFSLSQFNSTEEIEYTIDTIKELVVNLRKYIKH